MSNDDGQINRFGESAQTAIPEGSRLVEKPGHRLRSNSTIVDRHVLLGDSQKETTSLDNQGGDPKQTENVTPNLFTGPSYRNIKERFRFDGHKMLHHLDRILAWQKGERFAPIHIDMGLTKFCNTACIYCYAVVQNMDKGTMIQRDALMNYISDCGRLGVKSIGFIGDGEPTLNPALYDAAVLAKKVGVDTGMATNGLLLDMDRAAEILRDMTYIRFNLSAGTPEGFKKIHQSSKQNFAILLEKIRELVRIKKQNQYPCTLGIQMVLVPECFDQVLIEAELGAELGVDYFVIKQCADSEYKELGIRYEDYLKMGEMIKKAESLSRPDYVVQAKWDKINAASETPIYCHGIRKYDICYGTPFLSQISGNGKVYPCGPFFNKDRFLMGDLHKDSFYDIVMGDRYWQVHQDIVDSVDVHKDCCIGCRHDYINKMLWEIKNPPEHINFI
ncbi:MAG: radical SAM protein [Magnetococcus sp. DMHC-6]